MQRRHLLATAGSALAGGLAGCLGGNAPASVGSAVDGPDPGGDEPAVADPGTCSDARVRPLSERLLRETDEDDLRCTEPSVVVANERSDAVAVELDLESGVEFAADLQLDPGERVVERRAVAAAEPLSGTVTVDGERHSLEWPARSCYRHGIAITPAGVEVGWIEPGHGWGDVQHDCYVGERRPVAVRNEGGARLVRLTVRDRCTGTEFTERLAFVVEGTRGPSTPVVTGRDYEIEVAGLRVDATTHEFEHDCLPPRVVVDADGSVSVGPVPVV